MSIYTIEDELTPMPVATDADNTSVTPDLQQQLGALEAQRKADIDHINRNYQDLNQEYDDQLDIIDNLRKTVSRRKVVDPRAVQARQALGSLYDTIQLIGSAAAMAGNTTPPAPQLTSAQAQQNTIADRLYAAQRQADEDYATQLQHITRQQQQARADIARQRRQAKTEADRMRLNTNKHYDTLSTRITEGERNRRSRMAQTIFREDGKQKRYQEKLAQQGVKNSGDIITFDGEAYITNKKQNADFQMRVADFANKYSIKVNNIKEDTGLSGINLFRHIITTVLNGSLPLDEGIATQAYQDALHIFETFFSPYKEPQPTTTTTTPPASNANVWDEEELDW